MVEYTGFKDILVALDAAVLVVTFNRTKERNVFTLPFAQELEKVFKLADEDDRVRVVVVTADPKGPAYCAGADMSAGWGGFSDPNSPYATSEPGTRVAKAINDCRKITIAAVNGHSAGAGFSALQLPFDFRFAWAGGKIVIPFVRRAIAPESLSSYFLPRLVGLAKAKAIFLTGGALTPDSPLLDGLYYQSFAERAEVFPASLAFAKELAANTSQTAVALTKDLLGHPLDTIDETMEKESRILIYLSQQKDATEAAKSFIQRRPAKMEDKLSGIKTSWYPWWKTGSKL
ncbi:peroxisomal enoyl-CoA-hydratase [Cylindrobasidium torrendii FP15055 ss-10]|uniref:Peroxisomal enoyl-CoA-hydratase n=1 Tax=Cylindrobasidium torrendii FP15055 ss-10 TaxID=1314674 RepID=A0A0D7B3Q9_9AGAR|nr:peroxisomal enoyl-CoA-hydratase [Cylindrobasidium torrendii FP15055 ss-10]